MALADEIKKNRKAVNKVITVNKQVTDELHAIKTIHNDMMEIFRDINKWGATMPSLMNSAVSMGLETKEAVHHFSDLITDTMEKVNNNHERINEAIERLKCIVCPHRPEGTNGDCKTCKWKDDLPESIKLDVNDDIEQ